MSAKQIIRQRDFSSGEMAEYAKRRDDEAAVRAAARSLRNVRILSTGAVERRYGRSALFQSGRTDEIRMSPTATYRFCFSNGALRIRDSAGASVANQTVYLWTTATLDQIVWTQIDNDVVMTYPGQIPKIARWDGASTWTFLDWAARVSPGGQKRVPFTRLSPKGITMLPNARVGNGISVTFSSGMNLTADHVGTRMRFVNRQVEIASRVSATTGTIDIKETLPGSQLLTFGSDPANVFSLGDLVTGSVHSTSVGQVVELTSSTTMTVQLLTTDTALFGGYPYAFGIGEAIVGPGGSLVTTNAGAIGNPKATEAWDEEVFNSYRGWPRSCNVDQNRLIFCDFPAAPNGIAWSATLAPDDFYPGPNPTDAIFENAPRKARVYHVAAGADEFAMTDRGIYYIPISEANPLKPGSVAFRLVPGPAASAVRPIDTSQGTVYVNAGLNRVLAIVGTGQTAMPWLVRPVSDLHAPLFSGIKCLAVEQGHGTPPAENVYALNADGTIVVGRYQSGKEWVGWVPWDSVGTVTWVSALGASVLFTVTYSAGSLVEKQDAAQYLDAAATYNAVPSVLGPAAGHSVFWYLAGQTLKIMSGLRYIGDRVITSLGAVTPTPGDSFTSETFGLDFRVVIEPFVPHAQGGQSVGQTMTPRNVARGAVAVQNSTGFRVEGYKPKTAAWETLSTRPPYDAGESQDAGPVAREETWPFPSQGSDFDPRIRIVKDFPGPLRVLEIGVEIEA